MTIGLRSWLDERPVAGQEKDSGARDGVTSAERERIKELEREVRQLRQANEILRKASAYFAQAPLTVCTQTVAGQRELDRPFKP